MITSMTILLNIIILLLLAGVGASVFSFLNVVAYRLPLKKSFISGRDFCPNCGHQLKTADLFPVLSYLCLKGHCRYCGDKISPRYFLMEVFGAGLLIAAYFRFENYLELITVFIFLCILTIVTLIDIDTMEIPNGLVIALAIVGVISIFTMPKVDWISRVIGIFAISVPMLIIAFIRPGAFGGGDIKLMAACGIFLGWQNAVVATFIAILTGGIYAIILLASKKKGRKEHFAFGPFLCFGMAIAVFFGSNIINWYMQFFTI